MPNIFLFNSATHDGWAYLIIILVILGAFMLLQFGPQNKTPEVKFKSLPWKEPFEGPIDSNYQVYVSRKGSRLLLSSDKELLQDYWSDYIAIDRRWAIYWKGGCIVGVVNLKDPNPEYRSFAEGWYDGFHRVSATMFQISSSAYRKSLIIGWINAKAICTTFHNTVEPLEYISGTTLVCSPSGEFYDLISGDLLIIKLPGRVGFQVLRDNILFLGIKYPDSGFLLLYILKLNNDKWELIMDGVQVQAKVDVLFEVKPVGDKFIISLAREPGRTNPNEFMNRRCLVVSHSGSFDIYDYSPLYSEGESVANIPNGPDLDGWTIIRQ